MHIPEPGSVSITIAFGVARVHSEHHGSVTTSVTPDCLGSMPGQPPGRPEERDQIASNTSLTKDWRSP